MGTANCRGSAPKRTIDAIKIKSGTNDVGKAHAKLTCKFGSTAITGGLSLYSKTYPFVLGQLFLIFNVIVVKKT